MPPKPPDIPDNADKRRLRFEELYTANHDPILGFLLRRVADPQDAADLLGETFLTAWRRLDTVPAGDEGRLWLYGVARNMLTNHHRGERRRSDLAHHLRADLVAAYRVPEYDGDMTRVGAAFRSLSEADQELLALVGWEGLDRAQIAKVLGCSRNAVRIRLHRARKRFSRSLQEAVPARPLTPVPAAQGDRAA